MRLYGATSMDMNMIFAGRRQLIAAGVKKDDGNSSALCRAGTGERWGTTAAGAVTAIMLSVVINGPHAVEVIAVQQQEETLANIPQMLSGGECVTERQDCKKARIQRPKSRQAESCTIKCVGTCIRGGSGSPGEGPLNVRRPLVVFKQGFRSRQYCLVECSDICNLIRDGEDGP